MAKKKRARKSGGGGRGRKSGGNDFAPILAERLREVAGDLTYREVGERTGTHPENARRYMQNGTASVNFLRAFCKEFKVSADYLLEGTGSPKRGR